MKNTKWAGAGSVWKRQSFYASSAAYGIDFIEKYNGYSDEDRKLIFWSNALKLIPRLQKYVES